MLRLAFSMNGTSEPQPSPDRLEHRQGDVHPPLVGLHVGDERQLTGDGRDRRVLLQEAGDLADLLLAAVGTLARCAAAPARSTAAAGRTAWPPRAQRRPRLVGRPRGRASSLRSPASRSPQAPGSRKRSTRRRCGRTTKLLTFIAATSTRSSSAIVGPLGRVGVRLVERGDEVEPAGEQPSAQRRDERSRRWPSGSG